MSLRRLNSVCVGGETESSDTMSWFLLAGLRRNILRAPVIARTSLRGLTSLPEKFFQDPSRPGLFYHLLRRSDSPVYAVSFLKDVPVTERSKTIIGWLPATTVAPAKSESEVEEHEAGLHDFVQNGVHFPSTYTPNK